MNTKLMNFIPLIIAVIWIIINATQNHRLNKRQSPAAKAGYGFSLLSCLLLPVIFTPLGTICGIICVANEEDKDGIIIILMSMILGLWGAHLGGWGFGLKAFV
jgi:hypothetical protein